MLEDIKQNPDLLYGKQKQDNILTALIISYQNQGVEYEKVKEKENSIKLYEKAYKMAWEHFG